MNKEFMKKMIKAELLKYQAIKEILPDSMKSKVENLEKEALCFMKDFALEMISEYSVKEEQSEKKQTKKVDVDFK
ncbi:hypothetical protein RBH29_13420 [Herbivorax sp. ANBcel31]|uniref:hypothetical protein n=1 Tax=Herbivorax sp. ANBcel31 TaxID=3069754 RepID=UPI0027AE2FB7|nr:hypothetical protein [Herbivorax sp. ANBcel31]MDQ2087426.1 hypothetical protein [Herbivorax sp. ANBcel31]